MKSKISPFGGSPEGRQMTKEFELDVFVIDLSLVISNLKFAKLSYFLKFRPPAKSL